MDDSFFNGASRKNNAKKHSLKTFNNSKADSKTKPAVKYAASRRSTIVSDDSEDDFNVDDDDQYFLFCKKYCICF